MAPAPTPKPGPVRFRWPAAAARFLLGLFVVWQLVFLFVANGHPILEEVRALLRRGNAFEQEPDWVNGRGRAYQGQETAYRVAKAWGEVSAQPQNWSLFAPTVWRNVPFPAVELRWDEDPRSAPGVAPCLPPFAAGDPLQAAALTAAATLPRPAPPHPPALLLSDNEPADPHAFLRVGRLRLRRYEAVLAPALKDGGTNPERNADDWRHDFEALTREEWKSVLAYLRWRAEAFRRGRPELPEPTQMILLVRHYVVPPPGRRPWDWDGPVQMPVARWRPSAAWDDQHLPVETYNPVVDRFESLRR